MDGTLWVPLQFKHEIPTELSWILRLSPTITPLWQRISSHTTVASLRNLALGAHIRCRIWSTHVDSTPATIIPRGRPPSIAELATENHVEVFCGMASWLAIRHNLYTLSSTYGVRDVAKHTVWYKCGILACTWGSVITTDSVALMATLFCCRKFASVCRHLASCRLWWIAVMEGIDDFVALWNTLIKKRNRRLRIANTFDKFKDHMSMPQDDEPYTHIEIDPTHSSWVWWHPCCPFLNTIKHREITLFLPWQTSHGDFVLNHHQRPDTITYACGIHRDPMSKPWQRTLSPKVSCLQVWTRTWWYWFERVLHKKIVSYCANIGLNAVHRTLIWGEQYRDEENARALIKHSLNDLIVETCKGIREANYDKLGPDGIVPRGTLVVPGDVLIGKTMNTVEVYFGPNGEQLSRPVKRDQSQIVRGSDPCYVDSSYLDHQSRGSPRCSCHHTSARLPEIGDKFAMRHGQKGTVDWLFRP